MYRSLLVPLDGSLFAEQALPLATAIARRAGAALQVVQVHVPTVGHYRDGEVICDLGFDFTLRERENAYLHGVVQRLRQASSVRVTATLLDGPVADALCDHAVASGTDLVVMTTHGRGPLSRLWLGSVADRLLRRLPMPVLLARPQEEAADRALEPVPQHILIALDGSELAEQILGPALDLGRLLRAHYTLLRVIEPVLVTDYPLAGPAVSGLDAALTEELQREAEIYLQRVAERLREPSGQVATRVVVNRPVAAAILDEARRRGIGLVALQSRGRGGFARLLLGSVADKVVRGASTAVLVHHPVVPYPGQESPEHLLAVP